jgi:hypothetical protein
VRASFDELTTGSAPSRLQKNSKPADSSLVLAAHARLRTHPNDKSKGLSGTTKVVPSRFTLDSRVFPQPPSEMGLYFGQLFFQQLLVVEIGVVAILLDQFIVRAQFH